MRTMSGSPCLHYGCSNRNSFGYCKTTVCINEHYQQEQWGSPSSTNKSESVVIKQQTNADRIRNMTDEELASKFADIYCPDGLSVDRKNCKHNYLTGSPIEICEECWLEWLKKEAE